jgi:hypothetical protein
MDAPKTTPAFLRGSGSSTRPPGPLDAAALATCPKARERLEREARRPTMREGRLLRIGGRLEAGAALGPAPADLRAEAAEAREILQRLALASRRQPLSGELKVRAPRLVRPRSVAGVPR